MIVIFEMIAIMIAIFRKLQIIALIFLYPDDKRIEYAYRQDIKNKTSIM